MRGESRRCARVSATREFTREELDGLPIRFTADSVDLEGCTFFIVTVPTPIDGNRQPDLGPIRRACETVGRALTPGAVVVFESTVYPGVTEEVCGPLLALISGLRQGADFKLGYSPERINPGDREHRLETITKIVAAEDEGSLRRVEAVYGPVVKAGLHRAPTIRAAEAAKVIENTQRDLNIALMNELSIIFDRLGSVPRTCWTPPPPSGTSCAIRRAWSAATASGWTPITSPPRLRAWAITPRSSWPAGGSMTAWAPLSPASW